MLEETAARGVKIRVSVQMDNITRNEIGNQLQHLGIGIRDNKKALQTKVTTLIVDNALSLTVELKDDTKEGPSDSIVLDIFSNSESTILAYVSIFENMWMQSVLHKTTRSGSQIGQLTFPSNYVRVSFS